MRTSFPRRGPRPLRPFRIPICSPSRCPLREGVLHRRREKGRHSASMEKRWQTSLVPSREKVRSMKVTSPFARMIKTEEERVP